MNYGTKSFEFFVDKRHHLYDILMRFQRLTVMKSFIYVVLFGVVLLWLTFMLNTPSSKTARKNTFEPVSSELKTLPKTESETGFNWKEYIELNPDLAKVIFNEKDATNHYLKNGIREKRLSKVVPELISWTSTLNKIKSVLHNYDKINVPLLNRNLIVYHVGQANANNSIDIFINNMKIFTSSIATHEKSSNQNAFYLFNVVGGNDNPLLKFIPSSQSNVGVVKWNHASSDMMTHIRTINNLGSDLVQRFKALIFLNQGVRGPFIKRNNGEWLTDYRNLLDHNNVGIVGSTISCETTPHVQTHIFAIHSHLFSKIIQIIDSGPRAQTWLGIIAQFEIGLSTEMIKQGYNISAIMYAKRMHTPVFNGKCIKAERTANDFQNPTSWCNLTAEETVFMKWGGEPLRTNGYICDKMIKYMTKNLEKLAILEPKLELLLPEILIGGKLYDLYKEYAHEMYVDRKDSKLSLSISHKGNAYQTSSVDGSYVQNTDNSKVCFLVRTYDMKTSFTKSKFINYDLPDLIHSLLKQTSRHWVATFFNTDQSDYGSELQQYLFQQMDSRLKYIDIPIEYRPKFTTSDAGYTATDYVLSHMHTRTECKWITVSNGDNVYGSEVVQRILSTPTVGFGSQTSLPDMVLNPLDSRNFADQDYYFRREVTWDKRCLGIQSMLNFNRLAYTSQPIPVVGGVDLASVFLNREKFISERLYFSNFTDTNKYPCAGCQDGYFTEYLVRNRLWNYIRLPIDGLKSIIFHGPSPTLCIASGNVWFDHPQVSKVGCYLHSTVRTIQDDPTQHALYDWSHHYVFDRLCLRLNEVGYAQAMNGDKK